MLKFPDLPFGLDALEPFYSRRTLEYHHGKHHLAYVTNCNALIGGTPYEQMAVEELIRATASAVSGDQLKIFRNASQSWNHSFFWSSITPQRAKVPQGPLADHIEVSFGSFEKFAEGFKAAALAHFGSGWIWLLARDHSLEIKTLHDAQTPLIEDATPLLVCDLWEHAYYLDYQNDRASFVDTFLTHLANWDFAAQNLAAK